MFMLQALVLVILDSIAMMREEDQYATLNVAIQYSGLLNAGIGKIQE